MKIKIKITDRLTKTEWLKVALSIIALLLACLLSNAQSPKGANGTLSFQGALDGKMLIFGDEARAIKKGTIDFTGRLIMQGNQQKWGYMIIYPEFSIRDSEGSLKSFTANIGYTFNELVIPRSEVTFTAGWGWLDHYKTTTHSFKFTQSYGFKLSEALKFVIISDFTQRTDLKELYPKADNQEFKWNVRYGFEIRFL